MLEPGSLVDSYRIQRELGRGGMGVVYEATDLSLDRRVALKVIAPEISADPTFRARFEQERKLQAKLHHPGVVPVFQAGESEHGLFLVMPLIDGVSLDCLLEAGLLSPERTVRILGQIAAALDEAHESGLVHRDLKPQNILVDDKDRAYLADFGLTRELGRERMTSSGRFMGTVEYAAPEQSKGEDPSEASDIYSLTCVLYECLTGKPPFTGDTQVAVALSHISDERPSVAALRGDLPPEIDDVIARGMAADPTARYVSATELIGAAAALLAAEPPNPVEASGRHPGRNPAPAPVRPKTRARVLPLTSRRSSTTTGSPTPPTGEYEPQVPAEGGAGPRAAGGPRAQRRRRLSIGVLLGACVSGIAAVGLAVGGNGDSSEAGLSEEHRSAAIGLEAPESWRRTEPGPAIPGLNLRAGLSLAAGDETGVGIAAGLTSAEGRLLLPESFVDGLVGDPPRQIRTVRLNRRPAYFYPGLRSKEFPRSLNLYVLPTTEGVATIACYGPRAAELAECERVAASMTLGQARAYPLGPSERYAASLSRILERLERRQRENEHRLARASTSAGQATAARALSDDFAMIGGRARGLSTSPRDAAGNAAIASALAGVASAYTALADAAEQGEAGRYGDARAAVIAGKRRLKRALAGLEPLGYRLRQPG